MSRKLKAFAHKRIWITGASSGIGRATAIELAKYNPFLILSGRNIPALKEVARLVGKERAMILPFDVTKHWANIEAAQTIKDKLGGLDIAFFNAGDLDFSDVGHFDAALFEKVMYSTYFGMLYGIEAALPLLQESSNPHLVGMCSLSSYGGLPRGHIPYSAAKAAIKNMLEGLRIDLLPFDIPVSIVMPGFVKTRLSSKNDFNMPFRISVEKAAHYIVKGIARKKYEIHFPKRMSLGSKCLVGLLHISPWLYTKMMAWFFNVRQSQKEEVIYTETNTANIEQVLCQDLRKELDKLKPLAEEIERHTRNQDEFRAMGQQILVHEAADQCRSILEYLDYTSYGGLHRSSLQ